jgi:hypothetical protein
VAAVVVGAVRHGVTPIDDYSLRRLHKLAIHE